LKVVEAMQFSEALHGPTFVPQNLNGLQIEDRPDLHIDLSDLAEPSDVALEGVDEARDTELRLARELREAREALVALYRELPVVCQDHVVEGDRHRGRRSRRWSLERVESCYEKLLRFEQASPSPIVSRAVELARGYKRDLDEAREALVTANLHIVPYIVKRYSNGTIPYADLVQDGHIGLLRAVDRFDPDRGYRFSTYAFWWIRRSLSESFRNHSRLIRLPDSLRENLRDMRAARNELQEELGRLPTPEELAQRMEVSLKRVKKWLHVAPDPSPIDELDGQEGGWNTLADHGGNADPLACALGREAQQQATEALDQLDDRERTIIRLRFGFDADKAMTLSQIGKVVGLSRERVRQIERAALRKIQDWALRTGVCAA
jgi:RNA polymerase sigma factor (sigma-70 family)